MEELNWYLTDTHSHIYTEEFDEDLEAVIGRALENRVHKIYLPGMEHRYVSRMLNICNRYPDLFSCLSGLHPCNVKADYEEELASVKSSLDTGNFVGVGEIGLDFYWDLTFREQQLACFYQQLVWALEYNLPVVIHARSAIKEALTMVTPFAQKGLRGIFHCFDGTLQEALEIKKIGFYIGIGGAFTFKKNESFRNLIKETGLSFVVLETDAPYMAPVPYRGKRNESAWVKIVAEKVSEVLDLDIEQVASITSANAKKIFIS